MQDPDRCKSRPPLNYSLTERKTALRDLITHNYFRLVLPHADHLRSNGDDQEKIILGEYGFVSAVFDV